VIVETEPECVNVIDGDGQLVEVTPPVSQCWKPSHWVKRSGERFVAFCFPNTKMPSVPSIDA